MALPSHRDPLRPWRQACAESALHEPVWSPTAAVPSRTISRNRGGQSLAAKKSTIYATPLKTTRKSTFLWGHSHLILIHENGCWWGPHGFSPDVRTTFTDFFLSFVRRWKPHPCTWVRNNLDSVLNMSQTCCECCTVDARTDEKQKALFYATEIKKSTVDGWING